MYYLATQADSWMPTTWGVLPVILLYQFYLVTFTSLSTQAKQIAFSLENWTAVFCDNYFRQGAAAKWELIK